MIADRHSGAEDAASHAARGFTGPSSRLPMVQPEAARCQRRPNRLVARP